MKIPLYYFSATGNTLSAARQLATQLGNCQLISIASLPTDKPILIPEKTIIIAFPLFYLSYPEMVRGFVSRLNLQPGAEVHCLVTRGMRHMGGVFRELANDIKPLGAILRVAMYIEMPNNDVVLFDIPKPQIINAKLAQGKKQIAQMASFIQEPTRQYRSPEPFGLIMPMRRSVYRKKITHTHQNFMIGPDCTGCGICSKTCALKRIDMKTGKPVWLSGCQECEACINLCPKRTIQFIGSKTEQKGRYRNPEIAISDLMHQ